MVSKMRPCTDSCADSNEINYNNTDGKSGQISLLKMYLKICRHSMQQILTNIQTVIISLQIKIWTCNLNHALCLYWT